MRSPRFEHLLVDLAEAVLRSAGDERGCLSVADAVLHLPCEASLAPDGGLLACMPRGLWRSGFDPSVHRLRLHLGTTAARPEVR